MLWQALNVLEQVADAVETRLIGQEAKVSDVDAVLGHTATLLTKFMPMTMSVMTGLGAEASMRSGKLIGRFTTVMQRYQDALERARSAPARDTASAIADAQQLACWLRWQQPTVGWMMSDASMDSWLRPFVHQIVCPSDRP